MALYDITFLTKEEADPGVKAAIETAGGAVAEESSLGRRRLAFPIKKEQQAVYTSYVFDLEPTKMSELDRRLRLNTALLRHLIVVKELPKTDKTVSKTVKEAIAAAERLGDDFEPAARPVATAASQSALAAALSETEPDTVSVPVGLKSEIEAAPSQPPPKKVRTGRAKLKAAPAELTEPTSKSAEPQDAAEATETDRLKALEDKLSEILKD